MSRLLTEKNRIHGLVNERIIRRIFNYSSFWCKIETCDGIKFSEIQSHRNHIRIERTRRRCVTWIIDRVCINRLHKFIVWSHFSTKNLYNSGTDESRREENKEINRESTIGIDGKLVEAFSKRPRLVEKRQTRTIVRRWRAKSAAWPQPRSSDVKAFRWKGGEGKEGCDRIALRLLEPLNIAGRISLAFARPTALLDFPRPRFMRNECVSTPLSLPHHRPRGSTPSYRISTIPLATSLGPLFSSRSLKGRGKNAHHQVHHHIAPVHQSAHSQVSAMSTSISSFNKENIL